MKAKGAIIIPVWMLTMEGKKIIKRRLLNKSNPPKLKAENFPVTSTHFLKSDDVCATAYFYLDKPKSNLPVLPSVQVRLQDFKKNVWDKLKLKD